tara:strand:- start:2789 stop:2962 length:174 start_codon:yes stop_codon:yes gene_type:complete
MKIESAQYLKDFDGNNSSIKAIIDGVQSFVPVSEGNRHYKEMMRQVDAGELTIEDAD